MKKPSLRKMGAFLSIFLTIFLFNFCSDPTNEPKISDEILIRNARNYFESEVSPLTSSGGRTEAKYRFTLSKVLNWEQAHRKDLSVGPGVVVPISFTDKVYLRQSTDSPSLPVNTYLLIYRGIDKMMHAEVVTSMLRYEPINFENVIIEDWEGNFLKAYRYYGSDFEDLHLFTKSNSTIARLADEACVDWYTCVTTADGYTECHYDYTEGDCEGGGGVGGGGTGGTGGGDSGGGGGTGGGDYGGGGGGDYGDESEALPGIDCYSFYFVETGANWQEAVVTNIKLNVYVYDDNRARPFWRHITLSRPVWVGFPITYGIHDVSAGMAATAAALAETEAHRMVANYFRETPGVTTSQIEQKFIDEFQANITHLGGRASFTGSGSPLVMPRQAVYVPVGNGNCL